MKALFFCLFSLPLVCLAQDIDDELEMLSGLCHCPIGQRDFHKAMKHTAFISPERGFVLPIKCGGKKFFFLITGNLNHCALLNSDRKFETSDEIITYGPKWFYVKVSDREIMKYDFGTKMWSHNKIPEGSLGEEHF